MNHLRHSWHRFGYFHLFYPLQYWARCHSNRRCCAETLPIPSNSYRQLDRKQSDWCNWNHLKQPNRSSIGKQNTMNERRTNVILQFLCVAKNYWLTYVIEWIAVAAIIALVDIMQKHFTQNVWCTKENVGCNKNCAVSARNLDGLLVFYPRRIESNGTWLLFVVTLLVAT